jgi:hypothetical protein
LREIHQLVKNKGYWKANDKYFDVKVNAIIEAQSNDSDITFHYNDQWWNQADWTVEPPESLEELYLKRARDLRSKYKTLILRFSGGSDSYNVIRTFIDNDIKIDVVVVNEYYGLTNTDRYLHPSSAEKIMRTMPLLNEIKAQGVEFELLKLDNSLLFTRLPDHPNWIFHCNMPRFRLGEFAGPRTVLHPELKKYNNPDTCIISGHDKPNIHFKAKKLWSFTVGDTTACLCDPGHSHMVQEPFYHTADMPELVVKQCHVLKSYAQANEDTWPWHRVQFFGDKKWLVPIIYSKYFNFKPGDPLPYFDMPLPESDKKYLPESWKPALPKNDAPYDLSMDFNVEKMPIYNCHLQGVRLADKLIHRRFKQADSIFDSGLVNVYTKPRWLGR